MRVIAIGECMVELAPVGDGLFTMGYAGDTFNAAWYLRRLLPVTASVSYLSAVGTDAVSDRMLDFMAAEGIITDHVQRVPERSVGLYLIQLNNGERSFAYWRSSSAARLLAEDATRLDRVLDGADLIYLSGITLAILDADARSRLMASLAHARAAGSRVAFDPNIRPSLWPDTATMLQSITDLAAGADIVLPSYDDEARHFGDPDPAATAQRYASHGEALVVVKDGPRPIVTWQAGKSEHHPVPVPAAPVLDTTAAGDSFNAGFLASYLAGAKLSKAVSAGTSLAARVIAGPGALVRSAVEFAT
ncbi:sugar kinase [Tabrizicola sp.]|uniref:sugar kinase n=1 Tax=Tabrizicola sp. TaxID=2005166 RepID=UPI0026339187|nr:sugar kinase [Tabrizicola sp.]MDM7933582.1 sugar kinase [Tabrizicola sp.]